MLFGTILAPRASRHAHAPRESLRRTRRKPRPRRLLLEALEDRCLLEGEWVPYIPFANQTAVDVAVSQSGWTNTIVLIRFSDSGYRVSDWGQVVQADNRLVVDSQVWRTDSGADVVTELSHEYDFGGLAPADYVFEFRAWGSVVKEMPFTITGSPNPTTFAGTAGDDSLVVLFDHDAMFHRVTVKPFGGPRISYLYPVSEPVNLDFDGLDGKDAVSIQGGAGNENVALGKGWISLWGPNYQVQAASAEVISMDAGAGTNQVADLWDSPAHDTFLLSEPFTFVWDGDRFGFPRTFDNTISGFDVIRAHSTAGGTDEVYLYGSQGSDVFTVSPNSASASMRGPGFFKYASGFAKYYGYSVAGSVASVDKAYLYDSKGDDLYIAWANGDAWMHTPTIDAFSYGFAFNYGLSTAGGVDEAVLFGSDGDDSMRFEPGYTSGGPVFPRVYMTRPGAYFIYAQNFKKVTGYAGAGNDAVAFFDTRGNDTFTASPTQAQLDGPPGSNILNIAVGFDTVRAYSQVGGYDKAYLTGSTGDDTFRAYGKPRTVYPGMGRLTGTGYFLEVYHFEEVYANLLTGNDTANLYDGTANDYFWAKLGAAVLTDGTLNDATGDLVTPNTYYYKVYGFNSAASDHVNLWGTSGGTNTKKVITPLDYVLAAYGTWTDAP